MKEDFVTYEQAVKLKELGFDWETHAWYNTHAELWTKCPQAYPAPTLAQAQKWLREVKKIIVNADIGFRANGRYFYFIVDNDGMPIVQGSSALLFDTYEEGLSAGIDRALELLKEENNGNQD